MAVSDALGIIMLARGKPFPAETRKWADRVLIIIGTEPINSGYEVAVPQFKLWWEHNKAAVLAKQYNKANWLPAVSEMPAILAKLWGPPDSTPALAPQPTVDPTAVTPTSSPLPWLLGALAALALATMLALRLRRR
jgi:hypothetical protein